MLCYGREREREMIHDSHESSRFEVGAWTWKKIIEVGIEIRSKYLIYNNTLGRSRSVLYVKVRKFWWMGN